MTSAEEKHTLTDRFAALINALPENSVVAKINNRVFVPGFVSGNHTRQETMIVHEGTELFLHSAVQNSKKTGYLLFSLCPVDAQRYDMVFMTEADVKKYFPNLLETIAEKFGYEGLDGGFKTFRRVELAKLRKAVRAEELDKERAAQEELRASYKDVPLWGSW